jgi:hypothetical protein
MASDRNRRSRAIQPQLPLSSPPEEVPGDDPPRRSSDWQLDERTRQIGRQGIAAARALLGEPAAAHGDDHPARGRSGAGRAA